MRIYLLIPFLLCLVACTLERAEPQSIVLGHAGTGIDLVNQMFPPNSAEAIQWAIQYYQLDGVEADLQFTMDGIGVLYHDEFLQEETDKSGQIHQKMWNEIEDAVYRGRFSQLNRSRILGLDEMIRMLLEFPNAYLSLDIKSFDDEMDRSKVAQRLDSVITANGLMKRVFLETTDFNLLKTIKAENADLICLWNTSYTDHLIPELLKFDMDGIIVHHQNIRLNETDQILTAGLTLATYGQLTLKDLNSEISKSSSIVQIENPSLIDRN